MPTVDENFVKRIQPHSEEAERSVLGSMLMDRDAIVEAEDILTKRTFTSASTESYLRLW